MSHVAKSSKSPTSLQANYVVETIGRSRENKWRKRVEYLVFWEGYPPEEATWEPASNLIGTADEALRRSEEHTSELQSRP